MLYKNIEVKTLGTMMSREQHNTASLELVSWEQVRKEVAQINLTFAQAIDELNPGKKYPLVKVAYPYGSYVLKRAELMLPNSKGVIVPITDATIDSKLRGMLNYNLNSNPVSLVLNNTFEIFLPLPDRTIPMSGLITKGATFGAWRVLNPQSTQQPVFIWDMTAGARSIFMLPKITEEKKHFKLKKAFGVTANKPDSLIEHFEIFKQIASHPEFPQPWQAEILYFPKKWFDHLDDEAWFKFYYHFYRSTWQTTEYWRNRAVWDLVFSVIVMNNKIRPNAYIVDTVKYLLAVGIGAQSGFSPATNNSAGPISELQKIYMQEYDIRDYPPIIMHSASFDINNNKQSPIYYSLQFPTAIEFSPKSRTRTSLLSCIRSNHYCKFLKKNC
jgi:hypothetical protein